MNPKAPKILNDIVEALQGAGLTATNEDDEGRVNSKKDEFNVTEWLQADPRFKDRVKSSGLRKFGDIIVVDDAGVDHYVNIKTSVGKNDNVFSKLGWIWAFTDVGIDELNSRITNVNWFKLLLERKKETDRDYWFLSLDKRDMSKVMVRGVKQIEHWITNPTNNLQVTWDREHNSPLKDYTFEEAWDRVILNGVLLSWEKDYWGKRAGIEHRLEYLRNKENPPD